MFYALPLGLAGLQWLLKQDQETIVVGHLGLTDVSPYYAGDVVVDAISKYRPRNDSFKIFHAVPWIRRSAVG